MLEINKIHNLDVLEGLKQIDDESIDLFIFSPPYNLRNKNGKPKNLSNGGKWKNYKLSTGYDNYNDAIPHKEYVNWQKNILLECWRCIKPTGAIFYNHKPIIREGIAILPTEYNPGINLRQIIIWNRGSGYNFNQKFYLPTYEWIILFCKIDFKLKSIGASGIKDIWNFSCDKNNNHPAPFSLNLPLNILETAKYKDLVVDPFCGSGTVPLACKMNNCNFIGIEKSKEYCNIANKRLENYDKQKLEIKI